VEGGDGGEESEQDKKESNGSGNHDGSSSSSEDSEEIENLDRLVSLSEEQLSFLCKGQDLKGGKKFEMIGRLLSFLPSEKLKVDDLLGLEDRQIKEMCNARGLKVSGSKEKMAKALYNDVMQIEEVPVEDNVKSTPTMKKRSSYFQIPSFLGKRSRSEIFTSNKARKISITNKDFMKKATPIDIRLDQTSYEVLPKSYKGTNAFGWYQNGRQKIDVVGEDLEVAWNINITVIGSTS